MVSVVGDEQYGEEPREACADEADRWGSRAGCFDEDLDVSAGGIHGESRLSFRGRGGEGGGGGAMVRAINRVDAGVVFLFVAKLTVGDG